jgi:hypothetical protein
MAPECRRVRVARHGFDAPREDGDALARGAAAAARRSEDVRLLRFGDGLLPVAGETASADVEDDMCSARPGHRGKNLYTPPATRDTVADRRARRRAMTANLVNVYGHGLHS